jgi:hypothetical protein
MKARKYDETFAPNVVLDQCFIPNPDKPTAIAGHSTIIDSPAMMDVIQGPKGSGQRVQLLGVPGDQRSYSGSFAWCSGTHRRVSYTSRVQERGDHHSSISLLAYILIMHVITMGYHKLTMCQMLGVKMLFGCPLSAVFCALATCPENFPPDTLCFPQKDTGKRYIRRDTGDSTSDFFNISAILERCVLYLERFVRLLS